MQEKNKHNPHIDWSIFGKRPRAEINAEAAREKKRLGLTGIYKGLRIFEDGYVQDVPIPDVRAVRKALKLSQTEFAKRFCLSPRTIQQWEQRRALPDMPARVLLKAIAQAPDVVAKAAAEVRQEFERGRRSRKPGIASLLKD